MNKRNCLIIDDNPQDDIIEQIVGKAKKKTIELDCLQFNVGSEERDDLLTEGNIDINKVIRIFKEAYDGTKLDLICIDYSLEDEVINGLEVVKALSFLRPSTPFIIYSSSLDMVAKGIIDSYEVDKDKKKLINRIKSLTKCNIHNFVSREKYDEVIVDFIAHSQPSLELILEEKLLEYPDMRFQNTFPAFEGRNLQEIANEVRIGSPKGLRFKNELMERVIAYMLNVDGK